MTLDIDEYRRFIASRSVKDKKRGFTPEKINPLAKVHQENTLKFALNSGKSAAFLDTGLGKSFIELEFAKQCAEETGKPSLILTPLAVAGQMVREGHKFNIESRQIKEQCEVGSGVMVANYERLPKLDPDTFGAIVLDESSILKSFAGRTRNMLMDAFNGIGSTGVVALRVMRRYLGFELKAEYAKQAGYHLKASEMSAGDLFL